MENYNVLMELGEGSFGRVILVQHKSTRQKYAMKEIRLPKVTTFFPKFFSFIYIISLVRALQYLSVGFQVQLKVFVVILKTGSGSRYLWNHLFTNSILQYISKNNFHPGTFA